MSMINIIDKPVRYLRRHGIQDFAKESYFRISDYYYEKYFGVETTNDIPRHEWGIDHPDSIEYATVHYRHILTALKTIPLDGTQSVVDYGCGKGRFLVCAATHRFKKIVGVELSTQLVTTAKKNLAEMRHKKTDHVAVFHGDAREFQLTSDINVVYLYNPFGGLTLQTVANNIRDSFADQPRKIYIIYFNNGRFDKLNINEGWLRKRFQADVTNGISYGLYETVP